MEEEIVADGEKASFYAAFNKILSISIPNGQPAIFHKYKTPEKKIADEIKKKKEQRQKKVQKLQEKKKNYEKSTDIVKEKGLRRIALKGVVKLFNEIASTQLENKTKKIKEGMRKQSERFKRRMKRISESSETRKMINYTVEKPTWNVLREDFLKNDL